MKSVRVVAVYTVFILMLMSHEVSLCGGSIYSLYIDATVVLARYVNVQ
jgi:hypothetical protein